MELILKSSFAKHTGLSNCCFQGAGIVAIPESSPPLQLLHFLSKWVLDTFL